MTERFTLLSELGRGGMGVVWKARDEETGQIVALKLLREAYAEDPEYLARFERELELAKRIDSPHVVKVLGFGVRDKVPYLALEYVDGPSLHDALRAHGPYSWPETRALLIQLTQGLADANAAGVIHRDVKPSNVLIGPDGVAKLTDFGIARGLDTTRMTATSTMLGTPAYLAPEGPKDARSDLYSLGIIGYQLLTGSVPFKGTSHQEVIFEHVRTPPDLSVLPLEAQPIIGMLLAKDPAARPQRASALLPILYGVEPIPAVQAPVVPASPVQPVVVAAPPPQPGPDQWPPPPPPSAYSPGQRVYPPAPSGQGSAPSRPPTAGRRSSAPLLVGIGAVGLLVCLGAAALAGGFLSGALSPPASPLVAAGGTSPAPVATPTIAGFSPTGSMSSARELQTATLLSDGRVLITGGFDSPGYLATAELYDPQSGTFSPTGSMSSARSGATATLLSDGRVLITGGDDGSGYLATAELYDPQSGTFSPTGSMSSAREWQTATLLSDGRVLITGGFDGSTTLASAELYDPKTDTFTATKKQMTSARSGATATLLSDGRVLITGGFDGSWYLATAELYDPQSGTFSPTGSMSSARKLQTATLLSDGRVLITGGFDSPGYLATAELYDPQSGTFSPTGSMSSARSGATATLLSDGRVLITGGYGGSGPLATAEIYTP